MRIVIAYGVAIGLIWVGVLETASSSAKSFKQYCNAETLESQRSIHRALAVGFIGGRVVSKIISNPSHIVEPNGSEKCIGPNDHVAKDTN